jgi:uncharacterized membrane protein YhaH (DUF805 family)
VLPTLKQGGHCIARDAIPAALVHIDAVWKALVPKIPLRRSFSDELFNISYEDYRTMSGVVTGLSAFAFVIAIMGLIGMAIHITSRRLHKIAITMAVAWLAVGAQALRAASVKPALVLHAD